MFAFTSHEHPNYQSTALIYNGKRSATTKFYLHHTPYDLLIQQKKTKYYFFNSTSLAPATTISFFMPCPIVTPLVHLFLHQLLKNITINEVKDVEPFQ